MTRLAQIISWFTVTVTLAGACAVSVGCAASADGTTRNRTQTYDRAINLSVSDLPAFTRVMFPRPHVTSSGPYGSQVELCDGVGSTSHQASGATSATFESIRARRKTTGLFPIESVQSTVYVMSNPLLAHKEATAVTSGRGRTCIADSFLSKSPEIKTEGKAAGEPVLSAIKVDSKVAQVNGVPVYVLRTTAHTATETTTSMSVVNYYHESSAILVGRTIVVLNTIGSPGPFSKQEEQRLLAILVKRSRQAKL